MRPMMASGTYDDNRFSKQRELNDGMSIAPTSPDQYTNTISGGLR